MEIVDILGFRVSAEGIERDVVRAVEWVEAERSCRYMACANPHSLVVASRDRQFCDALQKADLLTPDGVGIVLAARLLNRPLASRVIGYDFFMALTALLAVKRETRYFFLGSSEDVLELMVSRLNREFPSITVCGIYAPPFKDTFSGEENSRMVKAINDAHGHEAGDRVLASVGRVLRSAMRREDTCARWGGEEFLFLLPETDLQAAESLVGKLLEARAKAAATCCPTASS